MISPIDIILISLYFVAIAFIGYKSSKKSSPSDYVLGSKKLSMWDTIATLTATKITASIIVTYTALVYVFGISALWIYIGVAIGYLLFLRFATMLKKEGDRHNYYSMADYFHKRYGYFSGKLVAVVMLLIFELNFVVQLIGGAKILEALTGLSFFWGVILCGGIVLFYLFLGGFKAVVKTDSAQFVAIILLFIALGAVLVGNFTFVPEQWEVFSLGPQMIIPFLLVGMMFPFSAPDMWQRVLAAKDVKSLRKSFKFATGLYVFFGFLLSIIALIIRNKLPGIDPDSSLAMGFISLLPAGLLGLGLVALFAAIMSSADSFAFVCGGFLMHDVLEKTKNRATSLKYGLLAVTIVGMLFAVGFQSIIDASYLLAGLLMGLSAVVLMTWIWPRLHSSLIKTGIIVSLICVALFTIFQGIVATLFVVGIVSSIAGVLAAKFFLYITKRKIYIVNR